ncbi:hypothetical protein BCR36DRAFT_323520 [Piromyces finnis]|uniref:FHA domain-containing protein n=1 Tax=Piromyces finnis TaxID=1754191 RepID=A0A1Y1VD49_9FUNG|nr:hypothetical protein BCR36DRAFT_323520 [Piromyces finnis]|eukprot:ORX53330.1 hypothetical protein BCR36DRAFT_323520 [Piromyces finnis]
MENITNNNNIALVNILLTKFAKEAQNLVSTAQKIYDDKNNIVYSQIDKFNEQWGILKGHCSTVGIAINGFKERNPNTYIQKIENIVSEINRKKFEVNSTSESTKEGLDGKTPRSGIGNEGLSTLPLIIINLLSTVKMAVEDYNEQVLGACINNNSPINDNDPDASESLLNLSSFAGNNESTSSLNNDPNMTINPNFNQSSSTLSCLSNPALQTLENEKVLSSKGSSKSSLSNEVFPSLTNNNNNNIMNNKNNNVVVINHPNGSGLSYTPKPLPFGFEEERKDEMMKFREEFQSRENNIDPKLRERDDSVDRRRGPPPPEDRRMGPRPINTNRKDSGADERRGREMDDRRRYDREKSCERRRMEGNYNGNESFMRGGNEDPRRGRDKSRDKSRDRRRMDPNESYSIRDISSERRRMEGNCSGNESFMRGGSEDPRRGRDKSRDKSRDRRRMDPNESYSIRDLSCDRRRIEEERRRRMESGRSSSTDSRRRYDREKSCERRRMDEIGNNNGNDRRKIDGNDLNDKNGHEIELNKPGNGNESRKTSRSSINLDEYKRKDSLDNPHVRKEKSLNNIKIKDEIKIPNLRKNCSMEDVRNVKPTVKVNVDIYPKRLDSHEKPPILKGDRSMISEPSSSTANSPFIGNCKANRIRTSSIDNIPSAVSVDSGTKSNHPNILGRQRNISNPYQSSNGSKTPKLVNYDPATRVPRKQSSNSNYEKPVRTPYSSNMEFAKTPLFSEPENIHSAVPCDKKPSQGITRKRSCSASYAQNPLLSNSPSNSPRIVNKGRPVPGSSPSPGPNTGPSSNIALGPSLDHPYHIRQESDPTLSHQSILKPNKSSPAIRAMVNNYSQDGIKKQIDNIYNELNSMSRSQHRRNISSSSINDYSSLNRNDAFSPHFSTRPTLQSRRSNISTTSSGTEATELLSANVQFINNFDKCVKLNEGMDRRSYLYEDYFVRNSEGELIDLQMVLVPLNNMFEICTIDLNEPIYFGRSNVNNVENFMTFRSLVISRTHAEIWNEDGKIFLKDLGSNGGTFLNGVRICQFGQECEPHEIKSGDFIQFGQDFFEGGMISPKMELPENPKHRCVKFQVILSNSLNINLYKNYDAVTPADNPEQEELEKQKRDIEKQIFEQSEKLKKEMEKNLASDIIKERDVYFINISAGSKVRKTIIKLESGIELFNVDLSNWDQKTSFFSSSKDKYKNNKIIVHDNRTEYAETQNIEILKELPSTKVYSIKTKYSLLGTVQYISKKKVQIVTPYGSPQFCLTGDFKDHQWIILETNIDNDEHNQRCIGEALGRQPIKKGVRETKWEIKLEVENSKFSQLLFSSFLFLIVTEGNAD